MPPTWKYHRLRSATSRSVSTRESRDDGRPYLLSTSRRDHRSEYTASRSRLSSVSYCRARVRRVVAQLVAMPRTKVKPASSTASMPRTVCARSPGGQVTWGCAGDGGGRRDAARLRGRALRRAPRVLGVPALEVAEPRGGLGVRGRAPVAARRQRAAR